MPRPLATIVASFFEEHLPPDTRKLLVALSGGADSVALLSLCHHWATSRPDSIKIEALHVHHGLRGEKADADARHCARLCGELEIPLHVVTEQIDEAASAQRISLETAGRDARRRRFIEICRGRCAPVIVTGHHENDQSETILGNMLRGCGLRGLQGMHPVSSINSTEVQLARPLLTVSRLRIEEYLQQQQLDHVDDESNLSRQFRRNRIRHDLIPALTAENPEFVSNLRSLSEESRDRWRVQQTRIDDALQRSHCAPPRISLPPDCWRSLGGPEIGDLLREAVVMASGEEGGLLREHLDALEKLATGRSRSPSLSLPGQRIAVRCGGWIHIGPEGDSSLEPPPTRISIDPGNPLVAHGVCWTSLVEEPVTLRTMRPGEKIPGRRSTYDEELRTHGVPPQPRRQWPLIEDSDGRILWALGIDTASSDHPAPVVISRSVTCPQPELGYHLLRICSDHSA